MIEIKNLKKYYGETLVLDLSNFSFSRGKIYSLIGGNGAGKSTLLKILYGLENPSSGTVVSPFSRMVYNPQFPLFLRGTLVYNMKEPFRLRGLPIPYREIETLLLRFSLEKLKNLNIETLSGGERAKAQFIRSVLYDKDFILLDEPTASMDKKSSLLVEEVLLELKKKGKGIILITHDHMQAHRISDIIIELDEGKII